MKEVRKLAGGAARKLGLRDPLLRLTSSRNRRLRSVTDEVAEFLPTLPGATLSASKEHFSITRPGE